jgi:GNAT superfamily N-acetyltransferase
MAWRLKRADFQQQKGEGNKQAMKALVEEGVSPGLLGYREGQAVAWCAVAPRPEYVALERSRILKPVDEQPVWSISCLFVAKSCRRQGVRVVMLRAAVDYVRQQGGRIVEGYPTEPAADLPAPFVWTGLVSAFLQAGFEEVARRSKTRPIMRYVLTP